MNSDSIKQLIFNSGLPMTRIKITLDAALVLYDIIKTTDTIDVVVDNKLWDKLHDKEIYSNDTLLYNGLVLHRSAFDIYNNNDSISLENLYTIYLKIKKMYNTNNSEDCLNKLNLIKGYIRKIGKY